ncbi:tyrosine-type recombinase/integrase [Sphingopyxis panaciterrulae]|uniref:Integrase n=1 Tax=Sphingopyxis panaciterrulae TaxID=462372 RepID=A0A7W9ESE1_9SPHN|nr:integrase arm-type DNA-binding domain-containing protein [Sphingopyxis panaciterrulae]MBB5708629.1 integrase [Sphingopyxis panaciterrulae]
MLTNVALKALKPEAKPYKKADGGGLFILIEKNGSKLWRFAYRYDGKHKLISGGRFPEVSLVAARAWRDKMKHQLALGLDPSKERQKEAAAVPVGEGSSFEEVAREWLKSRTLAWVPKYARHIVRRLENDIFPVIGKHDIAEITPRQMLDALRKIEARGSIEMAHRIKTYCSEIFRFAIPDGRCDTDPCRDLTPSLTKKPRVRHHPKVAAKDLPTFYVKLNADPGERLSHLALRWTIYNMVRTQETRFAEWDEFEDIGLAEPLWRLSPERMKMSEEHLVPLARQSIELLDEIRELNVFLKGRNMRLGRYLFPVAHAKSLVISENRMLDIMYRMGYRGKATVHGFRSLASTVLNESGLFEPDWIEMQLAHQPQGVRGVYNAARYLAHRRPMMQWWADFLDDAEATGMRGS